MVGGGSGSAESGLAGLRVRPCGRERRESLLIGEGLSPLSVLHHSYGTEQASNTPAEGRVPSRI